MFIVVSKVILFPCSVTVRNDMVGTTRCETVRYVEKLYDWCGSLQNAAGGTVLLRFDTVQRDMVR